MAFIDFVDSLKKIFKEVKKDVDYNTDNQGVSMLREHFFYPFNHPITGFERKLNGAISSMPVYYPTSSITNNFILTLDNFHPAYISPGGVKSLEIIIVTSNGLSATKTGRKITVTHPGGTAYAFSYPSTVNAGVLEVSNRNGVTVLRLALYPNTATSVALTFSDVVSSPPLNRSIFSFSCRQFVGSVNGTSYPLYGIQEVPTIDDTLSTSSTNAVENVAVTTEVNKKVNTSDIINNLKDNSTNKPLSANQGRILKNTVDMKVTSASGKVLSSNDYTNDDKTKLAGIDAGAEVNHGVDNVTIELNSSNEYQVKLASINASRLADDAVITSKIWDDQVTEAKLAPALKTKVNDKVDKVSGKELSSNDFTNAYKTTMDDEAYHTGQISSLDSNVMDLAIWNNTGSSKNITLSSNEITFAKAGVYNIVLNTAVYSNTATKLRLERGTGMNSDNDVVRTFGLTLDHFDIDLPSSNNTWRRGTLTFDPLSVKAGAKVKIVSTETDVNKVKFTGQQYGWFSINKLTS